MRVRAIQLAVVYEDDPRLPLRSGPALNMLEAQLGGQIGSLNVPHDAPAEVPRVALQGSDFGLLLGSSRIDFTASVPSHIASDIKQVAEYSASYFGKLAVAVEALAVDFKWSGMVWTYEIPLSVAPVPAVDVVLPLAKRLLPDWLLQGDRLGAFEITVGNHHQGVYKGFVINGYEIRDGKIQVELLRSGRTRARANAKEFPVTEAGAGVSVDINTKQVAEKHGLKDDIPMFIQMHIDAHPQLTKIGEYARGNTDG